MLYQVVSELESEVYVLSSVAMWSRNGGMRAIRPREYLGSYINDQGNPIR